MPDIFTSPIPACCDHQAIALNHLQKSATCMRCKAQFAWDGKLWSKVIPVAAPVAPPIPAAE